MADPNAVRRAIDELHTIVFDEQPLTATLERVTHLARNAIPEADEVSITLVEHERAWTAAFTGPLAVQLDERQYARGFGPCLDAAVTGQTVRLAMEDVQPRYPEFVRAARRQSVTHTLSVPMPVATRIVGALNLYTLSGRPFNDESGLVATDLAGYAAVFLANVALYHRTAELAEQMQEAMKTRAVIEQAKGVIMAGRHCTDDEAFAILTRLSQDRNQKLRSVAQAVVARAAAPR